MSFDQFFAKPEGSRVVRLDTHREPKIRWSDDCKRWEIRYKDTNTVFHVTLSLVNTLINEKKMFGKKPFKHKTFAKAVTVSKESLEDMGLNPKEWDDHEGMVQGYDGTWRWV